MGGSLTFAEADDRLWQEYEQLAARSYGHRIEDLTLLRERADFRVGLKDGKVVAGGMGLLVPQYFGGSAVLSACLGAGCVAPEERGGRLAYHMVNERVRALQEQGAVLSTVWTSSNGYARHMGWEAVTRVFAWSVATDDLKNSFPSESAEIDIAHGLCDEARDMQRALAGQWNGAVQRPHWWSEWKTQKSNLTWYRFSRAKQTVGLLSFAMAKRHPRGTNIVVYDFWAADQDVATSMLAFLGRNNSRAESVQFRRAALPPYPTLLHHLHRHRLTADAWHPWMLRILDARQAIRLRGWPKDLEMELPIEIELPDRHSASRRVLKMSGGAAELEPSQREATVSLTRGQFAVWYAGGYRSASSARMSGVRSTCDKALASLIRATTDHEPWLADHF
ncbi:GNAT family N-acetyltransferase [Streptomyces sp. VB1]|uniref:GNAT family N-acetyltransferase n=1 Tax=Streptomyces sp. VB1 TaxID=2986803 RepID=UPI002242BADD|nr:GNAT family N-acetyltransferase [Streptomyces sp. VB1]UZI32379.1 GNAT family N-acetyltransferase [Streptomyces sp. VB1]